MSSSMFCSMDINSYRKDWKPIEYNGIKGELLDELNLGIFHTLSPLRFKANVDIDKTLDLWWISDDYYELDNSWISNLTSQTSLLLYQLVDSNFDINLTKISLRSSLMTTSININKQDGVMSKIENIARIYPNKTCIYMSRKNYTYYELMNYVIIVSNSLCSQEQEIVILKATRGLSLLIGILSIWYKKAIYCPFEYNGSLDRLNYLTDNLQPSCILEIKDITLNEYTVTPFPSLLAKKYPCLFYIIPTSGTTGVPKFNRYIRIIFY